MLLFYVTGGIAIFTVPCVALFNASNSYGQREVLRDPLRLNPIVPAGRLVAQKRYTKNRKMNGASQRQLSKDVKEDLKKIHPSIPYAPLAI